jgi:dolichol-phosphate mannosyltransferase
MCVMDADQQHPPEMIPKMLQHAQDADCDLVIGSRFVDGASTPGLNQLRTAISETLIMSARVLFIDRLRHVKDPLTGFFLLQRSKLDLNQLHPNGFKILLEIIVQCPALKLSEVGFQMESRVAGESKASAQEVSRYFRKLIQLKMTHANPRFAYFLAVGLSGILVNSLALTLLIEAFHLHYLLSAVIATQVSTLWNFFLTEFWVFGDRRAHGSFWKRLLGFAVINNALLLVRGPMISGLVEQLHMHYVPANLISIGAATLLRYVMADKLLWSQKAPRSTPPVNRDPSLAQPL